jgi:hypothetical protein
MRGVIASLCFLIIVAFGSEALAWSPKLEIDEHTWIQLGFLGQFQFEFREDAAGEGDKWSKEFFTRRARIMGTGSVHERVQFFFDAMASNVGKRDAGKGEVENTLRWNNGLIDVVFSPELKVSMGRLAPPFSIENQASSVTLLGIDYNTKVIKLPTTINRTGWRDDGVEARGILAGGLIDYRLGVFRGQTDTARNPDHELRTTGMFLINLGDPQPGWFYNTNSLGRLNTLSFGAGYDRIPNSAPAYRDAEAWSVFALLDQPLGIGRVTGQAAFYDWSGEGWQNDFTGKTASIQAGYLLGGRWQPLVGWQMQDRDAAPSLDTFHFGLGYYLKGHGANFKVDYAVNDRRIPATGDKKDAVRFQAQIYF